MHLKVGSRLSKLALAQTTYIIESLQPFHPTVSFEIVPINTTGDLILDKTLDKIGGKGLFVKELEESLRNSQIDFAVHSYKDMPIDLPEDLPIVAVSSRENPFDVLVLPKNTTTLDITKPIGTSSLRRSVQCSSLFSQVTIKPVRGNVITRLEKLDSGEFSALILAYAGLKRLGLEGRISRVFTLDEMIPSACQGILAIQSLKNCDKDFFSPIHQLEIARIAEEERAFIGAFNGGCSSPVACFGSISEDTLTLTGMNVDSLGHMKKISKTHSTKNIHSLGLEMAKEFML